jgi:putative membrane protein
MERIKISGLYFLILVYVSGAIGFVMKPSFFMPLTPYSLLFTSLVFLINQPIKEKKIFIAFFIISFIGFIVEAIGVKTGYVFGVYYYGNALGVKLMHVPLVIGINWALLISSGSIVAHRITDKKYYKAFICGTFVTGIDFIMEQLAAKLDFWYFSAGKAEIQNYFAWFFISFCASLLFSSILKKGNYKAAIIVLSLQILFFGTLYLLI